MQCGETKEHGRLAGDKMASVEQRKQRRKRFQSGKSTEVGPCELFMRPRKKSADIEQLAHKYKQKCTVESSTESESDANIEVLSNSILYKQSLERTSLAQLQFSDPYDGDYEEISGDSDCSLGSLDSSRSRGILVRPPITQEENLLTEELEIPFSAPPLRTFSESVTQGDGSAPYKTAKILQLHTDPSCFAGPQPSKENRFSEDSSSDSVLPQPTLMECDSRLWEEPNVNRKRRRPVLECAGEKIKKRLRVT